MDILENNNLEYDFSSYDFNEVDGSDNLTYTLFKSGENAISYGDIILESPISYEIGTYGASDARISVADNGLFGTTNSSSSQSVSVVDKFGNEL